MAYFIFTKDLDNVENTLYRIAENESDLNNLNIIKTAYKIIEDSQINFNNVKYGNKYISKYDGNNIIYVDQSISYDKKETLLSYIINYKNFIKEFLNNNLNHPLYNRWDNYYNQLNNLNLNNISYPLNKSLEQYFSDLEQPSYNILQLP